MFKKLVLLTALILSQVLAQFTYENSNPIVSPYDDKDAVCKKLAKDIISCSIVEDYNEEDGFFDDTCIEAASDDLENCSGSVAFTVDEPLYASPYAAAGGVTSSGSLYAYYEGVDGTKIGSITCKDCAATLKKLLQCALPFYVSEEVAANALVPVGGFEYTRDYLDALDVCALELTSEKDLYALEFCNSTPGFELVPNDDDEVDYVRSSLSLRFGDLVEACPSVEATVATSGKVVVKSLKSSIRAVPVLAAQA